MEHVYTAYTKILQDKTYYFVKKIMLLPEFKGLADVVVGYGMHTDFEKACSIAGIDDMDCRKQLLAKLEEHNKPVRPVEKVRFKRLPFKLQRPLPAGLRARELKYLIDHTNYTSTNIYLPAVLACR